MPRPRKQPHLQRKKTPAGALVWIIRDGKDRISTGCGVGSDDAKAQQALADYINGKYQPPTGMGAKLLIDEVVAAYLAGHADSSPSRDFLFATANPILKWWSGKRIAEVNKTNCKAYVKWRTSQFRKRHPNSKRPPVNVSDQTARHDLKTLRAALRWYKSEHDAQMIVPTVTLPKKAPARKDYWLSRSEVARRIRLARKSLQTRHIARVLLIRVYSGTRPGAILVLRWLPSPSSGWIDLRAAHSIGRAGRSASPTSESRQPASTLGYCLISGDGTGSIASTGSRMWCITLANRFISCDGHGLRSAGARMVPISAPHGRDVADAGRRHLRGGRLSRDERRDVAGGLRASSSGVSREGGEGCRPSIVREGASHGLMLPQDVERYCCKRELT